MRLSAAATLKRRNPDMSEREEKRPVGKTGKKAYRPTRFMLPTSHYDKNRGRSGGVVHTESEAHQGRLGGKSRFCCFHGRNRSSGTFSARSRRTVTASSIRRLWKSARRPGNSWRWIRRFSRRRAGKTMGTLTLQDRVFDENGSPCNIVGLQRDRRHRAMLPARLSGTAHISTRARAASVECAGPPE